jgi:hypothetical protein
MYFHQQVQNQAHACAHMLLVLMPCADLCWCRYWHGYYAHAFCIVSNLHWHLSDDGRLASSGWQLAVKVCATSACTSVELPRSILADRGCIMWCPLPAASSGQPITPVLHCAVLRSFTGATLWQSAVSSSCLCPMFATLVVCSGADVIGV